MTTKELREAVDTYEELLRVHQLNIELLNTLELTLYTVKDFCLAHNIPVGNAKIGSLLRKASALLDEMDTQQTKVYKDYKQSGTLQNRLS